MITMYLNFAYGFQLRKNTRFSKSNTFPSSYEKVRMHILMPHHWAVRRPLPAIGNKFSSLNMHTNTGVLSEVYHVQNWISLAVLGVQS
jgi:hypothetical protein